MYSKPARVKGSRRAFTNSSGTASAPRTASQARKAVTVCFHMGEEWAHDENAATRAEAQAFKRACACFGLGRYLYDLGRVWMDLDPYDRPVQTPALPDWAVPHDVKRQTQQPKSHAQQPSSGGLARDTV